MDWSLSEEEKLDLVNLHAAYHKNEVESEQWIAVPVKLSH